MLNGRQLRRLAFFIIVVLVGVAAFIYGFFYKAFYSWAEKKHHSDTLNRGNRGEHDRVERGEGLPLSDLVRRLELKPHYLETFQPRYRAITLKKRRGGERRILAPDDETKRLQRRILRRLLGELRTHPAATGFEPGISIVENALPHVGQKVVVSMDIVDFFPATLAPRVELYFRWVGWDAQTAEILARIVTAEGGLPQGAPTSPRLANLVNFYLDVQLTNLAARRMGTYTRYADDIAMSFPCDYPRRVRGIVQGVRRILKTHGYQLHGSSKLHIQRRHQQQRVTGLVVNEKAQLPRTTRRWLRAVRHRRGRGGRPTLTDQQLAGWTALEEMIERKTQQR